MTYESHFIHALAAPLTEKVNKLDILEYDLVESERTVAHVGLNTDVLCVGFFFLSWYIAYCRQ